MTYMILRVAVIAVLGLMVWFGARRIWRDWTGQARAMDEAKRKRDLADRGRGGIIDLKRDKDGTFRPDQDDR